MPGRRLLSSVGPMALGTPTGEAGPGSWRLRAGRDAHGRGPLLTTGEVRSAPAGGAATTSRTERPLGGAVAALCGMAAFQASGAVALPVFADLGVPGTSGLRFAFAAVILLAVVRPRLRGWDRVDLGWLGLLGVVLAGMNGLSYAALDRIPLGTATTVESLGARGGARRKSPRRPHGVGGRRGRRSRADRGPIDADPLGLLFALLTAAALASYLLLQTRVVRHAAGVDALTLAITVAAVVSLPFAGQAIVGVTPAAAWRIAVSALLGVGLAYWLDARALRLSGPRRVGMLLSLDPALAAGVGLVLLGQHLPTPAVVGLALVIVASTACQLPADAVHRALPRRAGSRVSGWQPQARCHGGSGVRPPVLTEHHDRRVAGR